MEVSPRAESEARPRKSKTKGILKNGGSSSSREDVGGDPAKRERKQKERRGSEPRHVEIRVEPDKKQHRHRKHREGKESTGHREHNSHHHNRDSNIYDTPKGNDAELLLRT